jgi:hypothetical protein
MKIKTTTTGQILKEAKDYNLSLRRPREAMPANPTLAHLRASSGIKGAKATGWSAALSCTRRFLSFHNDETTRKVKESNPLR